MLIFFGNPTKESRAELWINDRRIGLVVIDEWLDMDIGEDLHVTPRGEGALSSRAQATTVCFEVAVAEGAAVPRSRPAMPWLRAKKGRGAQR